MDEDTDSITNEIADEVVDEPDSEGGITQQRTMLLWLRPKPRRSILPPPAEVAGPPPATPASRIGHSAVLALLLVAVLLGGIGYAIGYASAHPGVPSISSSRAPARVTPQPTPTRTPTPPSSWQIVWQQGGHDDATLTPPALNSHAAPRFVLSWTCNPSSPQPQIDAAVSITITQLNQHIPVTVAGCPGYGYLVLSVGDDPATSRLHYGAYSISVRSFGGAQWTVAAGTASR